MLVSPGEDREEIDDTGGWRLWTQCPGDYYGDVPSSSERPFQTRSTGEQRNWALHVFTFQQTTSLAYFAESKQKSLIALNYPVQEGSKIMALRFLAWYQRNFPDSGFIIFLT